MNMAASDDEIQQMRSGFIVTGLVVAPILMIVGIAFVTIGYEWGVWIIVPMIVLEAIFIGQFLRWKRDRARP